MPTSPTMCTMSVPSMAMSRARNHGTEDTWAAGEPSFLSQRRVEPQLAHRRSGVLQKSRAEAVVGLERVEATIQGVGGGRREPIVGLVVHGTHSTAALPWCHEGS